MARRGLLSLIVLVLAIPTAAGATEFGPGEAAAGAHAARPPARNAEFKVIVWYRRDDPLGTFKYEVYDLRRNQDIEKIDAWINEVRTKYPAYILSVHDVELKREVGATESLKVGSVIQRELTIAAGLAGIVVGGGFERRPGQGLGMSSATPSSRTSPAPRFNRLPGSPGGDRGYLNPNPPTFPVPVPYPHLPP
ncbi:MAG: hypothetical protein ACHRXM_01190 [Isosphaerales bacterium]